MSTSGAVVRYCYSPHYQPADVMGVEEKVLTLAFLHKGIYKIKTFSINFLNNAAHA